MGKLFGTDGVRGIVNEELTPELAFNLGRAGAIALSKENGGKRPLVLIGKDTRISGDMLESSLASGIMSVGGDVMSLGVVPTPAVATLARHYGADAGVVISASHNTFEYNGIKFFNGNGYKLGDDIEDEIEEMVFLGTASSKAVESTEIGRMIKPDLDPKIKYADFLAETTKMNLTGKKIVLDCANGAATAIAKMTYEKLGATVVTIGENPDGININKGCGSTHPELLQKLVIEEKADFGMAYDGDADRLIGVDELGRIVDGDKLMCICAKKLKEDGLLANNELTVTVMSNIGLHKFAEENGINTVVTGVGDRYVLESMLKTGSVIGGEQSGHMIFLNHTTTGDGILSSIKVIETVMSEGKTFSQLSDSIEIYPQVLVNAAVANDNKKKMEKDEEIKDEIKAAEKELNRTGRILIRPSGTEPVVRVMVEGKDFRQIKEIAEKLASIIEEKYER